VSHRPSSDAVAGAIADYWRILMAAHPDGWFHSGHDAFAATCGGRLPALNSVRVFGPDPQPEEIDALLDEVAARELPYALQMRPGAAPVLGDLARKRGMAYAESSPLMVLDGPPLPVGKATGLRIRELEPEEIGIHTRVLSIAFEMAEKYFAQLMVPSLLEREELHCYVGEVDGRPVVTGLGARAGEHVGVFNVATVPDAQRRGYAGAMTARVIEDGRQTGAAWAWLHSSPSAYRLYQWLGFHAVESWDLWVAVP
jgi:GNAT superfamily N-acetyltransferase